MRKTVYIIPGFTESTNLKSYQQIIKLFRSKNFKVIPIKISWKNKVMSDYIKEFQKQIQSDKDEKIYLFGFSFGAMIALISAVKIKPKMIFLCSLSPYFREDLPLIKKSWKNIFGKKRIEDFQNFPFNKIAKNIKSKTILLVGEKEVDLIKKRIKKAEQKIKNSKLFIIAGAKHDISQKIYLDKIKEIIKTI